MNQKETLNGHGFFRKSKAYGLICGIALGLAFLGGKVNADEIVVPDGTDVPVVTEASQTIVEPASDDLTTAITNAEEAGVTVSQDTSETVVNQEEAQADYASQAESLAAVTVAQEQINAENAQITADNQALNEAYDNAKAQAESTNQAVLEAQATYPATVTETTVNYGDETSTTDYQAGQAQAENVAKANSQAISDYLAKKAEVDAYNAQVKAREDALKSNDIASDEANYLYVTGEFDTNATGLAYYQNIKVVTLDPNAKTAQSLGWQDNTTISNANGVTVTSHDTANDPAIYGTTSDFLYKVTEATVGDTFTLNNIGKATDGTNINAIVTITKASALTDKEDSWFVIGKTADNGIAVDYWNYDNLGLSFQFVDDSGNAVKLVVASVVGDVDNDQTSKIEFDGNTLNYVNPDGSGLIANADKSLTGLGFAIDGYQNAPQGTYLMVGSSTTVNYTHTSDDNVVDSNGNIVNYIEFDLFGTTSMVTTEEFKYLPDPTLTLTSVTLPTSPVETPLKDNLTATYHLNEYDVALTTVKDVLNSQGISIDGGELQIGETGHYTLEGAKVLANGKETLVKYDFEDYLEVKHDQYQGYSIYAFVPITLKDGTVIQSGEDLKAYAQAVYDDVTGHFYVSLNSDFLAQVAKDSDFQAKVDIEFVRIAAGDVYNDFTNHLAFADEEGNITEVPVVSNEVVTYTVEPPVEETPETPITPTSEIPTTPEKVPVVQSSVLPMTGDETTPLNLIVSAFGVLMFVLGIFGIRKRNEN
ncbi:LPXTG cell wall anchor domain-containing protein [Streptococcus gallolyticus subsp. gallolyticus]|uniref:putative cross-wall-targeting lipoprotein signal domain-containing proteiin n=1 Tax=Streptococcus gallolyticus TaxID=315405 RepID=UPI002283D4CC|nr:putative cross-wall-targeting lipoprotein signal domain-containing proteiin [Streptococcus gallolyticus]MCY7172902.1 LPXTG cell wall anchor domain-containing protein [Streptococcus gallolyticus subsp. gallolyticus]MCY7176931.1 LPXTG cell wall anchor domain-containing protein [Streptococcus gallolyticus subsp. gallolyticus]MCY7181578.1 LPXTG cell wall anchor domain-containing protein [Streptococcus gallolyticus subsp. gallolyticus]MCY7197172.1 LPXTG cell wall anchor domain-containing protein 